jgi:tetratricopeptide (TPR) repeat protein
MPRLDVLALALIAFALAFRIWGVGDRLPDPSLGINVLDDSAVEETDRTTMGRAWMLWNGGSKRLDLNPHTGGWPGFSFYVGLAIQATYKTYYVMKHPGTTAQEFVSHISSGSNHMFLYGRIVGALIGAWTVFLTFRLGSRFGGRAGGLLAGLFLALNPLHVMTSQHIADPNLLALLFVLLAALAMIRVAEGGGTRDSVIAGAMIGLAGACKYVPLILVIPLAMAHGREFFRKRAFYLGLLAVGVAMFAASPFTFIDWKMTIADFSTQRKSLFSDWVGQTTFPFSLPTYLAVSLPHVMGWPAYLLSIAGMVLLWRRGGIARPIVMIPIVIVLANGALKAAQERYVLVALPILFIAAVIALLEAAAWLRARPGVSARAAAAAPGLAILLALAWPLPEYLAVRRTMSLPDTRHLARKWINEHIGPDRPIAVELYGPIFQPDERSMVIWPFFATQVPLVRPAYHHEFLEGLDYYVLSREVSRRFDADSVGYPVESGFYRWIRANTTVAWRSEDKSSSGPAIEVRRVPAGISTEAQRDSLFAAIMPTPSGIGRVALWCFDFASAYGRLRQYDRAVEWAHRGLKVDAKRLNARLNIVLSFALLNLGRFKEAESAAAAGIRLAPRDHLLRIYHATALHELGFADQSLDEFRAAYELSHDPKILVNLGAALSSLGRYDEAVQALNMVPMGHPDRGDARRDMAVIFLNHLDRPAEGLAALREAASLATDPGEARLLVDEVSRIEAAMRRGSRPRVKP